MLKKWTIKLSIVLMMFMCFTSTTSANAANNEVAVQIDGVNLQFNDPPELIRNRVMVPMRVIFEALNATILWDNASQTITAVTENNDVIKLSIGSIHTWKNDKLATIDSPPLLKNGRTLVPLRFIAEALDKSVKWEAKSRTVVITSVDTSIADNKLMDTSNISDTTPTQLTFETEPELVPTAYEVYEKMIALKANYPEGMRWTNDNFYEWQGGIYSGGYGCVGFAFILSDAVFGKLPARKHTDFNNIQVGDIIRVNNDTHSVVILKIDETTVTLAEGNYNSSIHWERVLTFEQLKSTGDFIMTRYPK